MEQETFVFEEPPMRKMQSCNPCRRAALVVIVVFLTVMVIVSTVLGLRYRSKKIECTKRVEKDATNCSNNINELTQAIDNIGVNMGFGHWRLNKSKSLRTGPNDGLAYYLSIMGNSCTIMSYGPESNKPTIEASASHNGLKSFNFDKKQGIFTFTITLDKPLTFDKSIPALNSKQLDCTINPGTLIPLLLVSTTEMSKLGLSYISFYKKLPENGY